MKDLSKLEECLIHLFEQNSNALENDSLYLEELKNGKYFQVIRSPGCEELFSHNSVIDSSIDGSLQKSADLYAEEKCLSTEKQLEVLCIGIASLQGFLQCNWTGPSLSDDSFSIPWYRSRFNEADKTDDEIRESITDCLTLDGESCWRMKQQELLLLARVILQTCAEKFPSLPSSKWWLMRCLFTHQQILDEHSPIIHDACIALIGELATNEILMKSTNNVILFNLEAARIYLYYGQVVNSKDHIRTALNAASMKVELVGALGKRTRFQQTELAQLTLKVTFDHETDPGLVPESNIILPEDISLQDEVRLNHIKFSSESDAIFPTLRPIEQAILIGLFVQTQKSQPKDKLADEELMPYISCLLSQPRVWNLQTSALLMRCHLESNHRRTIERSMLQAQTLVDTIAMEAPDPMERLRYLFCSHLPHRWAVEAELASLMVTLGAFNGALDIYLRLELWEEVIVCYNLLKLRHKAAEIIEQQLKTRESVKLWCLLGDATDDPSCYEKAWELSGARSGRAQRHWGLYFFYKKQYAESIPHLQQSLAINSIQPTVWFMLGFAAMLEENWSLCAQAYRRYCEIDTDSFEAWNNLAKAYIKLGEKARAWKTLQEALKCNYENWQVWDNLMVVSTDCGEFEEVIRSYHRLLDLKGKHIDEQVLRILVTAIVNDLPDNHGLPASRLKKAALALFGRLTGQIATNATLWQLYAKLTASVATQTPETLERTAQYLQRAHRAAVQNTRWEREPATCLEVMQLCSSLADAYLACCENCPTAAQEMKLLTSAKLSLQGVVAKVTKEQINMTSEDSNGALASQFSGLESKLQEILAAIQDLPNKHSTSAVAE